MKKHLAIIILIQILNVSANGQNNGYFVKDGLFRNHNCPQVHNFQQQTGPKTWFVFGENVNIRQDTGLQSPIIGKLKIGQKVEVLSHVQGLRRGTNGHPNDWAKIRLPRGDTGFVFEALLAKTALFYDFNDNGKRELIMAGTKFDNDKRVSGMEKSALKLVEGGKIVNSITLDSLALSSMGDKYDRLLIRVLKDPKLRGGKKVLELSLGNNFCGEYWESVYLVFEKADLKVVFRGNFGFYKDEPFDEAIFPSDPGGKPNKVLLVRKRKFMNKSEEVETKLERVLRVIEF